MQYQHKSREWWDDVAFTDESTFRVSTKNPTRHLVRRRYNAKDRYKANMTARKFRITEGITTWCAISSNDKCPVIVLPKNETMRQGRYCEVLADHGIPFMRRAGCHTMLQDSAPCHVSKMTKNFLRVNLVRTIDWPGNSQ